MDVFGSTQVSGIQAATAKLNALANNYVNASTPGFQPDRVDLVNIVTGGVIEADVNQWDQPANPTADIIRLEQNALLYDSSAMIINVSDQMYGSLLNILDSQNPKLDLSNPQIQTG